MINRRELIMSGAIFATLPRVLSAATTLPVPAGNRLSFSIMRKGTKLGTHTLTFSQNGDQLVVTVAVSLMFKLFGVTLYRYTHHATETWHGNQVVALESQTSDNGTPYQLSGTRTPAGFAVQGSKTPRYIAPSNALPATHWNKRELDGPWINTQDGKLMHPKVARSGSETLRRADGSSSIAQRYILTGDVDLTMYYDDAGWAGLSFEKGGAPIIYVRDV